MYILLFSQGDVQLQLGFYHLVNIIHFFKKRKQETMINRKTNWGIRHPQAFFCIKKNLVILAMHKYPSPCPNHFQIAFQMFGVMELLSLFQCNPETKGDWFIKIKLLASYANLSTDFLEAKCCWKEKNGKWLNKSNCHFKCTHI